MASAPSLSGEHAQLLEPLPTAACATPDEESGEGPAGTTTISGWRWRQLSRPAALALGLGTLLAAALCLALPSAAAGRGQGPVAAGSLLSDIAEVQSKSEAAPSGFDFATAVAIKWTPHPEDCLEVHIRHFNPDGQKIETTKCGTRSKQFKLPEGLSGQITWAGHPNYCLAAPGHGALELDKCADVAKDVSEFVFQDGQIRLKSSPSECVTVDSHSTDDQGRHEVAIQDCDAWGGDSLFPPAKEDFLFSVDWPEVSTEAPTTEAPTTEAPTTKAPTTEAPTTAAPTDRPKNSAGLPSQIILKSTHGKYVVAELGGGIYANRGWADDWEKFSVVDLGEGSVALKTHHGHYITSDAVGTLSAIRKDISDGAHFQVKQMGDGAIALKTSYGKYVAAERLGFMIANRRSVGKWEEFEIIDVADKWPAHVAIKSVHGKYFRAYPHGGLVADGTWPLDDWEKFQATYLDDGTLTLRCDHGEYMVVESDGKIHASTSASASEHWKVTHLDDGNFTMQSHTGRYVWANLNGEVLANHQDPLDAWEKLQVVMVY